MLLGVWAIWIKVQEPVFFQRQGVPFYWSSVLAMLWLVLGLLPLVSRLTQDVDGTLWALRSTRCIPGHVLGWFLAHVWYGTLLIGVVLALSFSVESIWGQEVQVAQAWATGFAALAVLLVTAALAPAFALIRASTGTLVGVWLAVQALCLHGFGFKISGTPVASLGFSGIVCTILATLGGMSISLAISNHRLRI